MKPDAHKINIVLLDDANPNSDCYEKLAPIYEELYGDIDAQETVRQWWQLLVQQKLLPRNPQGLRLLDVGCGPGWHLMSWRELGFDVAGLDSSASMLKIARKNLDAAGYECPFYQADIRDVGKLPDLSGFDFAVSHLNFFNLFPREERALLFLSVARMVRPGGIWMVDFSEPYSPPVGSEEDVKVGKIMLNCSSYFLQNQNCHEQRWKGEHFECRERYWFGHAMESEKIAAQAGWRLRQRVAWHPNVTSKEWSHPSDADENLVDIYERLGEVQP